MSRFYLASDWTAKKLEVEVDIPSELDVEGLRGKGLQPGEIEQPVESQLAAETSPPKALEPDPSIVDALKQMGFSENGSMRAAVATQVCFKLL